MHRTKQRLGNQISKESTNTNTILKVNIESNERLLPNNNINHIVDVSQQFNIERQNCSFYKILGTINQTTTNCLFNLTDSSNNNLYTYSVFNNLNMLSRSYPQDNDLNDDEDLNYTQSIDFYLKENNGWFGYHDPNILEGLPCKFIDMEPKRQRFSYLQDNSPYKSINQEPVKNWELTITYPFSVDKTHPILNNGLLIIDVETLIISEREMTAFAVACKHNLEVGDIVEISGTNGFNGKHSVYSLGVTNGDLKEYYFVIDKPNIGSVSNNSRINKIVNNKRVEYYFRLFKKIKTKTSEVIENDDYETYQAAFSENIYNDPIIQFVFNEEIDVKDLKDNLGRPLSELYLTTIKTDSNNLFTEIKSGIELPFIPNLNNSSFIQYLLNVPVIQKIHNGINNPFVSHNPLENSVLIQNDLFYGDLVEYNQTTLLETVLADVHHRFNTKNRELNNIIQEYISTATLNQPATTRELQLGPRQEGYYYKPHHLIKIRNFSNYIEEADQNVDLIPNYATLREDGKFIWRDLLSIGFNDGEEQTLDYPFLNGSHYRYQNYFFNVKRQDPYAQWGLLYTNFPSDIVGERITDIFTINNSQDVC
jgi:hypothetical protein